MKITGQITLKGRLFVVLSSHYCQDDGSCQCGWKPKPKDEYPEKTHSAHLAAVVEKEIEPEITQLVTLRREGRKLVDWLDRLAANADERAKDRGIVLGIAIGFAIAMFWRPQ